MNNKKVNNGVTLDSRVLACVGSINFKEYKHSDLPKLIEELEKHLVQCKWVENYYLIYHDETDTPHIHYVLELSGQKRLKTLLNDFERMGYNREAINIDKLGFLSASIRYFIHIDEESIANNKKLYSLDNIISNMPYEYLEDLINLEDDEMNAERLINICIECDGNHVSIMKRLGLKRYHKYRCEINDILNYDYALRFARDKERERRKQELFDKLPF